MDYLVDELVSETIAIHGRSFQIYSHPVVKDEAQTFINQRDQGTLRFFDAVLPRCDRMIDFGAYMGFTALYAAQSGVRVTAFEPSGVNFQFLSANVEVNPTLASRIKLFGHGIGAKDEHVTIYMQQYADSEASVFQHIERDKHITPKADARIELRDGNEVLRDIGLNARTLLHIDIEGSEYAVLPAIAGLLAERKPWLHVSFHPFNLAAGRNPQDAAMQRLSAALKVAEATSCYRYMHMLDDGEWMTVGPNERASFLNKYILQPKTVPGIASPQFGFIDAVAFSDQVLPIESRTTAASSLERSNRLLVET